MASYLPKKKYLSQLGQDSSNNLVNYFSSTYSQQFVSSGVDSPVQSPSTLTASSRVPSFLLLADSQKSLSDNDIKLLGSLCSERFGSGISLDTLEKLCHEQEVCSSGIGDDTQVNSNFQHPYVSSVPSPNELIRRDGNSEDLMVSTSRPSLPKRYESIEELRTLESEHDTADVTRDVLLPSLPSLSSFSSLSDVNLNAHPSSGSFSSFLNSFDVNEGGPALGGSLMKNLLTGQEESDHLTDMMLPFEGSILKTLSSQNLLHLSSNYLPNPTCHLKRSACGSNAQANTVRLMEDRRLPIHVADDQEICVKDEEEQFKQAHVTTSGRNRGSGRSREPKYECQVCGDVAAGYHCGAYVCEACKKFYLRCLKTRGALAFLCPKNNDCDITKDTRSHCQYCRFQKCISLGMYKPGHDDDRKLKINFKVIPCKVCSAPSSGFHFGAITCEGCKGFFRRMLKEQLHKKFVCVNEGPCSIDSANRTTCKCCRFEKCLQVGMTLEGTRLGRQSNSVKRHTLMQYVSNNEAVAEGKVRACRGISNSETSDEMSMTNSMCTSGRVKEEEDDDDEDDDSSSEPLCINFPRSESTSYKRRASLSPCDSEIPDISYRDRIRATKTQVKSSCDGMMYKDILNWKSDSCANVNVQAAVIDSSDRGELSNGDEINEYNDMNFAQSRSRVPGVLTRFHLSSRDQSHLVSENLQHSYRSFGLSRGIDEGNGLKAVRHLDNRNAMAFDFQCDTRFLREQAGEESTSMNHRTLKPRSVGRTDCFRENRICSSQTSINKTEAHCRSDDRDERDRAFARRQCVVDSDDVPVQIRRLGKWPSLAAGGAFVSHAPTDGASHSLATDDIHPCQSKQEMFEQLVTAYRELEDISQRPSPLDELQFQPVSVETIWKLVEIPFIHQSKIILRFIKNVPGFRQLGVKDQIKIAQDSLYPIVLLYHSRSYDIETGEFDWFISTPKERDLILSVLTPFRGMVKHFQSFGQVIKDMVLTEEELAFIAAMSVISASGNKISGLEDDLIEAFVSHQQKGHDRSVCDKRVGELLARLPELKRANMEHRLIVAEVQQMIPEIEMSHLYQEIFLSS